MQSNKRKRNKTHPTYLCNGPYPRFTLTFYTDKALCLGTKLTCTHWCAYRGMHAYTFTRIFNYQHMSIYTHVHVIFVYTHVLIIHKKNVHTYINLAYRPLLFNYSLSFSKAFINHSGKRYQNSDCFRRWIDSKVYTFLRLLIALSGALLGRGRALRLWYRVMIWYHILDLGAKVYILIHHMVWNRGVCLYMPCDTVLCPRYLCKECA